MVSAVGCGLGNSFHNGLHRHQDPHRAATLQPAPHRREGEEHAEEWHSSGTGWDLCLLLAGYLAARLLLAGYVAAASVQPSVGVSGDRGGILSRFECRYCCLTDAIIRRGVDIDSENDDRVGIVRRGATVCVLEHAVSSAGQQRVWVSEGWVSVVAADGTPLLVLAMTSPCAACDCSR